MIGGNQQVTAHRHLEPATDGEPVDRSDHRLVQRPVFREAGETAKAVFIRLPPIIEAHLTGIERLEIPPGGKDLVAPAGQDGAAQVLVLMQLLKCGGQRLRGRHVNRVHLGTVERDLQNMALADHLYAVRHHVFSLLKGGHYFVAEKVHRPFLGVHIKPH